MFKAAIFNQQIGFLDAVIRINHSHLLNHHQYISLCECENLEDLRSILQSSPGYESGHLEELVGNLTPRSIFSQNIKQLLGEIEYFTSQTECASLKQFMEFFHLSFAIENASLLLGSSWKESRQERNFFASQAEITEKCHPLGIFDSLALLNAPDAVIRDVCGEILLESPLARYLHQLQVIGEELEEETGENWYFSSRERMQVFVNSLFSAYWDDFFKFCQENLDGFAGAQIKEYIQSESDLHVINVVLTMQDLQHQIPLQKQQAMFPKCTSFSKREIEELSCAKDWQEIGSFLVKLPFYQGIELESKEQLERALWKRQLDCLEQTFCDLFSIAPFFAYFKLKEREIRNVYWICECISKHLPKELYMKNCIESGENEK